MIFLILFYDGTRFSMSPIFISFWEKFIDFEPRVCHVHSRFNTACWNFSSWKISFHNNAIRFSFFPYKWKKIVHDNTAQDINIRMTFKFVISKICYWAGLDVTWKQQWKLPETYCSKQLVDNLKRKRKNRKNVRLKNWYNLHIVLFVFLYLVR
jgi:hypothetical protein